MGILAEFLSKIDFGVKWMLWGEQKIEQKNYPKNLILPQGKNWPKMAFYPIKMALEGPYVNVFLSGLKMSRFRIFSNNTGFVVRLVFQLIFCFSFV